jgi:hypothetical protein
MLQISEAAVVCQPSSEVKLQVPDGCAEKVFMVFARCWNRRDQGLDSFAWNACRISLSVMVLKVPKSDLFDLDRTAR